MADGDDCVVDFGDGRTDHDLVLAAGLDDAQHAIRLREDIVVCLRFVLQAEAEPRDAVRDALDVVLSTHILDDDAGQPVILACHDGCSFSVMKLL